MRFIEVHIIIIKIQKTLTLQLGMGISALETLSGQAFGTGRVDMLRIYMQRSIIALFGSCFLILPLYIFAGIISLAIVYIPQLFSFSLVFPTQKFLQSQSKVAVLAWIAAFALVAQFFCGCVWVGSNRRGCGNSSHQLDHCDTSVCLRCWVVRGILGVGV